TAGRARAARRAGDAGEPPRRGEAGWLPAVRRADRGKARRAEAGRGEAAAGGRRELGELPRGDGAGAGGDAPEEPLAGPRVSVLPRQDGGDGEGVRGVRRREGLLR